MKTLTSYVGHGFVFRLPVRNRQEVDGLDYLYN